MELTDLSDNLTIAILQIIFYLSISALAAYLILKFQNIAKKEDLEEITKTVENVRSELKIITDKKFELYQEQKRVLLEFYLSIDDLITTFVESHELDDKDIEGNKAEELIRKLQGKWHKILTKQGGLNFFIEDSNIIEAAEGLVQKLGIYHGSVCKNMKGFIHLNHTIYNHQESINKNPENKNSHLIRQRNEAIKKRNACESKVKEQKDTLRDDFRMKDLKHFADICRISLIQNHI